MTDNVVLGRVKILAFSVGNVFHSQGIIMSSYIFVIQLFPCMSSYHLLAYTDGFLQDCGAGGSGYQVCHDQAFIYTFRTVRELIKNEVIDFQKSREDII